MHIKILHCLFSNHIFTNLSLNPVVANNVPSGLKLIRCTGVAVRHFQTQFHAPGSFPLLESPGAGLSASPIEKVTVPAEKKLILFYLYNYICLFNFEKYKINKYIR